MVSKPTRIDSDLPPLPGRPDDGHKGTFGRVLLVAGSNGMTGAAALAGESALRSGAGLVYLACPASSNDILETLCREVVTRPQAEDDGGTIAASAADATVELSEGCDSVCVGPGLGNTPGTAAIVRALLSRAQKPLVLDADALNVLSGDTSALEARTAPTIITPHPGEMQRLTGSAIDSDAEARAQAATALSRTAGVIVLLKGRGTVVADGDQFAINETGNSGMATAGSGDVLAGIIAALLGQKQDAFSAARLGAHLHGLAGDLAAEKLGRHSVIAGDILDHLPNAFLAYGAHAE